MKREFKVYGVFFLIIFFLIFFIFLKNFKLNYFKKNKLVLISVLDQDIDSDCRIKGSINIPFEIFEKEMNKFDMNKEYVLYCTNYQCSSSGYLVKKMREKGFNAFEYSPGVAGWFQKGLPCIGKCKAEFLREENEEILKDENFLISTDELLKKMAA